MEKKKKTLMKINPKGFDPKKYIETEPKLDNKIMSEDKAKTVVLTFGRFSPPTIGHEKLVSKIKEVATARRATPMIFTSHTQDKKKNPLSYDQKIQFLQIAFGNIVKKTAARTLIEVAKELTDKYDTLIVIVGSDRVPEFQILLDKYNGKEFNFKSIEVISAGERDPDSDDVSGMSASKLRALAVSGNFETFKKGLPSKLKPHGKDIYEAILKGMKLMEELDEEVLDEKVLPLTYTQRLARSKVMKRYKGKIAAARRRAQRRLAPPEKLKDRARKKALVLLRNRLSRAKSYGDMSPAEKLALDQRLSRVPQSVINRIATKQLPVVRKAEMERLAARNNPKNEDLNSEFEFFLEDFMDESDKLNKDYHVGLSKSTIAKRQAHFNKGAKMDDDNPDAYKPAPGDARSKTKPSVYTKRFHKLFNNEGTVKHDKRFKMYKSKTNIFESTETYLDELHDLIESIESIFESSNEGLKKKAEQTGISYGILKKVFDRGVAAWRTGHRPGTTPAQWGYSRVNSFATGGKTRQTADADLWTKHKGKNESLDEGAAMDMARASIERERKADAEKHKNMLDNARKADSRRRIFRTESSEFIKKIMEREKKHKKIASALKDFSEVANKTKNRIDHMTQAVKIVKSKDLAMKPEDLVKLYHTIHNSKQYEKTYNVFDAWESVDKTNPSNREQGTDSLVQILKNDTPGESKNKKVEEFLEAKARGFEGDMINVPNVKIRTIDGAIKSFPSGKSSSSKGGNGD
jgi:beta-glucosidase-like glycosyl hydrolase